MWSTSFGVLATNDSWAQTQRAWQQTLWANPNFVRAIAILAVALLVATIWLFRRRRKSGRAAAIICLVLSVTLHLALILWVPQMKWFQDGGGPTVGDDDSGGSNAIAVSMFNANLADVPESGRDEFDGAPMLAPLPLADSILQPPTLDLLHPTPPPAALSSDGDEIVDDPSTIDPQEASFTEASGPTVELETPVPVASTSVEDLAIDTEAIMAETMEMVATPSSLISAIPASSAPSVEPNKSATTSRDEDIASMDDWLAAMLSESSEPETVDEATVIVSASPSTATSRQNESTTSRPEGFRPGDVDAEFATRQGSAKQHALSATGGDAATEAAVAAALARLAEMQDSDGAWDPASTGGGLERAPLGITRGGAGRHAKTAITGLALLSFLGAGHTHQHGDHTETVYQGLVYLLGQQRSDGSLAGAATIYAAHYAHAMASLAIAEAGAMTGDPAAVNATRRAMSYTREMQHPITGGWRYTKNDPGDLSQLGWHVMSIDAAMRSGAMDDGETLMRGAKRFLRSVSRGSHGGLASYRPGENVSVTMTAEALAARLMIGDAPEEAAIDEAVELMLQNLPARGSMAVSSWKHPIDNYYYWYYATIALHQLQNDAWQTWNETLKERLLGTQAPDGSWPATTMWGGYGGTAYTTAMATLCLESYYRHSIR
ncbi:MAG: squalene--hopene cyclase [Planctomycetota bacterium]